MQKLIKFKQESLILIYILEIGWLMEWKIMVILQESKFQNQIDL